MALLANLEDWNQNAEKGGTIWKLQARVQLDTDYEIGPKAGFTLDCEDEKTTYENCVDVPWSKRPSGERACFADRIRWKENYYAPYLMNWMMDVDCKAKMQSLELVITPEVQPYFNVEMWYGPSSFTAKQLQTQLQEGFDHSYRAGDINFSLLDMTWTKVGKEQESLDMLFTKMLAFQKQNTVLK